MAAELPDDFKCPISLEIMSDPVILSSGHTFDRASIQRWLDAGHRTCPITKLPLPEPPTLIPNHALRSLISNFTPLPKPPQPPHDFQSLIHSPDKLASLDSAARRRLAESGAVAAVLAAEPPLQEKALRFLLNLSLDDDNKVGLVAEGVVGKIVSSLLSGAGDSRAVAATVLTSLAVLEVNKVTIGSYPDAIPGLVSLLQIGNSRERKEAATALFTLCSFSENRVRAVQAGSVPVLLQNAGSGLDRAVEVLGLLAKCKIGRDEMLRFDGILEILIKIIRNGSTRGIQYALIILSCLCCYSEKLGFQALEEGLFEISVGLMVDENEKVRRNAKILIQVLQGKRKTV